MCAAAGKVSISLEQHTVTQSYNLGASVLKGQVISLKNI